MGAAAATTDALANVETFAVGLNVGDEPGEVWAYTARDLAGILRNWRRLSVGPRPLHRVPVVETHGGTQALGWVTAARLRDGILFTDWGEVAPGLMRAIRAGRYKKVSAEIKPDFMDRAGRHYGPYLYRVAVLGADVPRNKGLADIPARFADPAPGRRSVRAFKFAEARHMADTATVDDKRKSVGDYYNLPQELIDSFSDDQVEMGATAILKDAASGGAAADTGGAADGGAAMAQVDGVDMSREEIIAELVDQYGEDAATLDGKTDQELADLLSQYRQGGQMSDKQGTQKQAAPAVAQTFADPQAVARVIDGAVRRGLAQINRAGKALADASDKRKAAEAAAAHDTRVRTFCDQMVREGRQTPADLDESNPHVLSELQMLLRLDDTQVRTFSEGGKEHRTTDLEAAMEAIRRRPARKFSERVLAGGQGNTEFAALRERTKTLLGGSKKRA